MGDILHPLQLWRGEGESGRMGGEVEGESERKREREIRKVGGAVCNLIP